MLQACRTYLTQRLEALTLPGGQVTPFVADENIFFDELPLDFLKDHDYAVSCLLLQDRSKPYGKLTGRARTLGVAPAYALIRRRFSREIMFRCLVYAKTANELWGASTPLSTDPGLAEQFQQVLAEYKLIFGSDESAIKIQPQDHARPWDAGVELERKQRRPRLAIVRVLFSGGIQTTSSLPIIPSVSFLPMPGPIDPAAITRDSSGMAMTDERGEVMTDSTGWNSRGRRKYVLTDSNGDIRRDSNNEILTDSEEA